MRESPIMPQIKAYNLSKHSFQPTPKIFELPVCALIYYESHLIDFFHQNGYFLNETLPYDHYQSMETICVSAIGGGAHVFNFADAVNQLLIYSVLQHATQSV